MATTPQAAAAVYSKSKLLTDYPVVRIRDEIDVVLQPNFDHCKICNTKLLPGIAAHPMTYDIPLTDNAQGFALFCEDCWFTWTENLTRTSSERVIVPPEVLRDSRDSLQYVLDVAGAAVSIARDYPECPPLKVYYGAPDGVWTYRTSPTSETRAILASYCIEMPSEVAPHVPLRAGTFTHDAFPGIFTHRDVYTLKVSRNMSEAAVDGALRQWIDETLRSSFDSPEPRKNLLSSFGRGVTQIGHALNFSAFKHQYRDEQDRDKLCYKVVLRVQLEPSVWEPMFLSFQSSFLDADGDAQVINNDEMMWSQVFTAPRPLPEVVQLRNGDEVPPGRHSIRMREDRLTWATHLNTRRQLVLDAVAQFQRIAQTPRAAGPPGPPGTVPVRPNYPPEVLTHDSGQFVNIAGELRERQGDALVDVWQYRVNAQRVASFEANTLIYIGTMDGRRLLCFRPDPNTKSSTTYAYVPHFCPADPSSTLREMQVRGFVQASDLEPTLIVDV